MKFVGHFCILNFFLNFLMFAAKIILIYYKYCYLLQAYRGSQIYPRNVIKIIE